MLRRCLLHFVSAQAREASTLCEYRRMTGVVLVTVGLLVVILVLILVLRPVIAGPQILAVGICAQSVIIALVVVPSVGPNGAYAALWKEAVVGLLLVVLFNRQDRSVARRLPVPIVVVLLLTALQLVFYMAFPAVTGSSGVPVTDTTARLAGLRQWIVPLELLLLGHALHNSGLTPTRLLAFVTRFGAVIAAFAVTGWVLLPLSFWAGVNMVTTTALSGDTSKASGQQEGLESYFLGQAVPRAVAPFGSPLALAFALLLPLCLMWVMHSQGRVDFPLLLVGTALVLTQTRGVLLSVVVVWLLWKLRTRKIGGRTIVGLVILAALASGPLSEAFANTLTLGDPSSKVHYDALSAGFAQLLTNPVGVGLGQGGQIGRAYGSSLAGGESLFLVAGNERGWLGLALVVALFVVCFRALRPNSCADELTGAGREQPEVEALRRGSRSAVAALALASITTEHAVAFISTWLLWVAVGYSITSLGRPVRGYRHRRPVPVRVPVAALPNRSVQATPDM